MSQPNPLTREREITCEVDLCLPDGTLNRDAIGFSRHPLQRCNLQGSWGRKKRWDYWCVTSPEVALALTYADLDYVGLVSASCLELATGRFLERAVLVPLGRGLTQPETVGGGDIHYEGAGLRLTIHEGDGHTELGVTFQKLGGQRLHAEVMITRPKGHETLNVVVPFSDTRFQFTSKQNTLPAQGYVALGGRRYEFGRGSEAYATLDFGRGKWPRKSAWNWGAASGRAGQPGDAERPVVGLQFGGKWTDHTGVTESGVVVDGRLSKIGEALEWTYDPRDFRAPWRIRSRQSESVDVRFVPVHERALRLPLGDWGASLHQCFGHYSGHVQDEGGRRYPLHGLVGWAEEMRASW